MSSLALRVAVRDSHSTGSFLEQQYVLRACCMDYRRSTGKYVDGTGTSKIPELDGNKQHGKIAPLTTFNTTYGHCVDGMTRVFEPVHHDSMRDWLQYITELISKSIDKQRAWDLDSAKPISVDEIVNNPQAYSEEFRKCIEAQIKYGWNPIAVYPAQAYVESNTKRGSHASIYALPSQSTLMTGILGGINNNCTVEMGFYEAEGTKNIAERSYRDDMLGFLCAGHTAHSEDAGKSRRISSYTRVRVISKLSLWMTLDSENTGVTSMKESPWIVYCMGSTFRTDLAGIVVLVRRMDIASKAYSRSQFSYPENYNSFAPPTYLVCHKEKILLISISPGVILRMMPDGSMIDSAMLHYQPQTSIVKKRILPAYGSESLKYKYSAFFLLVPYLEDDRPPRTLIASGQTVQAICMPWAPATATVSPSHVSLPLVATQFMRDIQHDQETNDGAIWDILPGEDMMVCFANHPLNYDDAMIISSKFADYGGFETLSICTYRISARDTIPEKGEELCMKKHQWWKVPCPKYCLCKDGKFKRERYDDKIKRIISDPRTPTGLVIESNIAENGEWQIKILSHSQIITGDKISTMHGQKGVVRIVPMEDLPMVVMPDGQTFTADLYIAVGSITSRQTVGQMYESGAAYRAVRDSEVDKVESSSEMKTEECKYLMDGISGQIIMTELENGKIRPVEASVGFIRVFNQTQLTRERHHLTHSSEGKFSVGTTPGRSRGGGIATSEMDFHAMFSSGLIHCAQELLNRGNVVRVDVCLKCKHIEPLCDCEIPGKRVPTRLSYDIVVFDILSACINQSANTYDVEHV